MKWTSNSSVCCTTRSRVRITTNEALKTLAKLVAHKGVNKKICRRVCNDEDHANIVKNPQVFVLRNSFPIHKWEAENLLWKNLHWKSKFMLKSTQDNRSHEKHAYMYHSNNLEKKEFFIDSNNFEVLCLVGISPIKGTSWNRTRRGGKGEECKM